LSPISVFTKGAAKIWSDAKTLHCNAILATTTGGLADLPLIAQGKKQKGDWTQLPVALSSHSPRESLDGILAGAPTNTGVHRTG
jgi:hypothetical protein